MILLPVYIFLPATICLFWVIIHCIWSFRTENFWINLLLIMDLALFLIADSYYLVPGISFRTLTVINLIMILTAPSIIPLVWLYLEKLRFGPGTLQHPAHILWVVFPTILFSISLVLTSMMSMPDAQSFYARLLTGGREVIEEYHGTIFYTYYIWTVVIFRYVLLFELLCFLVWTVYMNRKERFNPRNLHNFLFKGKPIRLVELQEYSLLPATLCFLIKISLYKDFTDTHPGLTILISTLLSLSILCYIIPTLFS